MNQITIKTGARFEMIDITGRIRSLLQDKGFTDGFCFIFVPHTTAAVTINENADPDVPRDIITIMDRLVPLTGNYRHLEGNSAAHVKASLIGASEWLMVENGGLVLGTWQSVFFCEFDGPRTRKIIVRLLPSKT
jgi:secondary thiamine-phosphate synthase enzyme